MEEKYFKEELLQMVSMNRDQLPYEPDFILPLTIDRIQEGYIDIRSAKRVAKNLQGVALKRRPKLKDEFLTEAKRELKSIEDTVDDVLYWDENENLIYVEAIAFFQSTRDFVRFRKNLPTKLHIKECECPVCRSTDWVPKNVDAKTVRDKEGRSWKCFSIIFVCNRCVKEGRLTTRSIRIQGIKYALIKIGRGLKYFLQRIEKIGISCDLLAQTGSATVELGEQKVELKHCPLL